MEQKCPCENCICVAICHFKEYGELIDNCSLVSKYLIEPRDMSHRPIDRLKKVKKIIKPTLWNFEIRIDKYIGEKYSWIFNEEKEKFWRYN